MSDFCLYSSAYLHLNINDCSRDRTGDRNKIKRAVKSGIIPDVDKSAALKKVDWSQLNSTPRVAHSPAVPTAGGSGSNANVPATPTPAARTLPPTQPYTQASQASQPLSQAMAYYPNVYGGLQPGYGAGAGIGASQPTIPAKRLSDQMEALGTQMTTTQGSQPWRDDDEDEGGEDNELAAADELFVIINTNVVGIQYYDGECDFFPTPSIFHSLFTHPPTPASFLPSFLPLFLFYTLNISHI